MAVSSQGMQNYNGAKSGDWLASWLNCQPRFQFPKPSWAKPWNEAEISEDVHDGWRASKIGQITSQGVIVDNDHQSD